MKLKFFNTSFIKLIKSVINSNLMEISEDKLIQILKSKNSNKKDEIFQLDAFINNFQSEQKFNHPSYYELFVVLIENKLTSQINSG
jgi:hypothetical protein